MTIYEMRAILDAITYKPGWVFRIHDEDGRPYLQAEVSIASDLTMDPTRRSCARTPWKSGKRYLSRHMCRQEIVGAVYGLIQDAEIHEMREWFRYKGASIYNPHLDPDALVEVARKKESFSVRQNAMSMAETDAATPSAAQDDAHPFARREGGLKCGVYRILWADEGKETICVVGMTTSGTRWIAGPNWVSHCDDPKNGVWSNIERAEMIAGIDEIDGSTLDMAAEINALVARKAGEKRS